MYERMLQWLHRDREGKLVFDDRPFVYYTVRLAKVVEGKIYTTGHEHKWGSETLYSGTITITFNAYDPFGKMTYISYDGYDEGIMSRSGIIPTDEMPPAIQPSVGNYLVYNPGTEMTDTVIKIAGTAPNGITIRNQTTGDVCEFISLPSGLTLIVDSEHGSISTSDDPNGFAFEYHDMGYIRLKPCIPYERDVAVSYIEGSNIIDFTIFDLAEDNVGQHVRLNGEWVKILSVSGKSAVINKFMDVTGSEYTMLATLNEISIEGDSVELELFELSYEPCIR